MIIKVEYFLLCLICISNTACALEKNKRMGSEQAFKSWALSQCVAKAYNVESVRLDAQASAAAYLEAGSQPIEAYEEANMLLEAFLKKKYEGSIADEFTMMKCIDFFQSAGLIKIFKKYSK